MKVFVMTDLEGVSGIVGRSDGIGNRIENMEEAKRLLTGEVNATVEGLVRGGADEIVVADGHGGSNSILAESFNPAASLLRASGELFPPTWTLDDSFDAAVQIGAHAMMGTTDGFLHHSFNSHGITHIHLNGVLIGEIGMIALLAGHFGVPTLLVSGDRAACREALKFLPKVATVETKIGINRYASIDRSPETVRNGLAATAENALRGIEKIDQSSIPRIEPPYACQVRLMCPNLADGAEKRGARRVDFLTVEYAGDDFVDVFAQRVGWGAGVFGG